MTQETFERAKMLYETANADQKYVLESLFPELAESEDEKIRKGLIQYFNDFNLDTFAGLDPKKILAWLEKMKVHLKFCKTIQIGDIVTRNEGGVLVNMSQLDRIAKKCKKQGEQKVNYTTLVETGNDGINALVTRELPTNGGDEQEQDVNILINPSEYINDMGGNGCYLKNTTQTSTWSEEDETNLEGIIDEVEANKSWAPGSDKITYDRYISWLKSLRPRKQWKPSEEQMDALETAVSSLQSSTLEMLYQDLKRETNYE